MSFWKKVSAPMLMVGLASPALVNCDALGGLPGAGCPALQSGNFAELNFQGEAAGKLKGFIETVYNFDKLALEIEGDLIGACKELGVAVGIPEADLAAEPGGGDGAKKACEATANKVKAIIDGAGSISLNIEIGEPRVEVDVEAMMSCLSECGAAIDPGQLEASCEGGEISGTCEAECTGTCTVEAGADCSGSCAGTCEGTCNGEESSGKCEGTCEGKCSTECKMEGKADCSGTCSGGCSAEIKAPKCSGEFKPPSVDAECHSGCVAETAGSAKVVPPSINITVDGEVSGEVTALIDGLKVALPKIVAIGQARAGQLVGTAKGLVEAGAELPSIASSAGLEAVGCIAMAVDMVAGASASLSVSVEMSASVSGSASGSTEG